MSRPIVEGQSRDNVVGNFPDATPVVTLPAPTDGVVYRDPQNGGDFVLTQTSAMVNLDTGGAPSDHTFNFFLRGTAVPGGELNANPLMNPGSNGPVPVAEGDTIFAGPQLPLVGDMRVEVEMVEAIDTIAPSYIQSWQDSYAPLDDLTVVPVVPRIQLGTFNDGAPFVIDGPDESFSTRTVKLTSLPALKLATQIVNIDTVAHNLSVTLRDANGPDQVLVDVKQIAAGGTWGSIVGGEGIPAEINLKQGQSLEIATATATTTNDPYVYATYEDRI